MISARAAAEQILAYLNGELNLQGLVEWSEDALLALSESEGNPIEAKVLMRILGYIGAGDTPDFPLTWDVLREFLDELGVQVKVLAV